MSETNIENDPRYASPRALRHTQKTTISRCEAGVQFLLFLLTYAFAFVVLFVYVF